MQKYYDIIIIGTGAGGGTLAYALASTGNKNTAQSPCIRCDTCDGYPCVVDAKADALCCVDKALKYLYAISTVLNKTVFQKILAINDFYFGSSEDAKPLGHVHLMGKHKWEMKRPDFCRWVANSLLKVFADPSVDWWMQSQDLPNVENRVEIAKNKQIKVYYRPNNQKAHRHLRHQFEKVLRKAGFLIIVGIPMLLKVMNHQGGTCRSRK